MERRLGRGLSKAFSLIGAIGAIGILTSCAVTEGPTINTSADPRIPEGCDGGVAWAIPSPNDPDVKYRPIEVQITGEKTFKALIDKSVTSIAQLKLSRVPVDTFVVGTDSNKTVYGCVGSTDPNQPVQWREVGVLETPIDMSRFKTTGVISDADNQRTNQIPTEQLSSVTVGSKECQKSPAMEYRVIAGDTLYKITRSYGRDFAETAVLNGLKSPYVIRVGQIIKLPATDCVKEAKSLPMPAAKLPEYKPNQPVSAGGANPPASQYAIDSQADSVVMCGCEVDNNSQCTGEPFILPINVRAPSVTSGEYTLRYYPTTEEIIRNGYYMCTKDKKPFDAPSPNSKASGSEMYKGMTSRQRENFNNCHALYLVTSQFSALSPESAIQYGIEKAQVEKATGKEVDFLIMLTCTQYAGDPAFADQPEEVQVKAEILSGPDIQAEWLVAPTDPNFYNDFQNWVNVNKHANGHSYVSHPFGDYVVGASYKKYENRWQECNPVPLTTYEFDQKTKTWSNVTPKSTCQPEEIKTYKEMLANHATADAALANNKMSFETYQKEWKGSLIACDSLDTCGLYAAPKSMNSLYLGGTRFLEIEDIGSGTEPWSGLQNGQLFRFRADDELGDWSFVFGVPTNGFKFQFNFNKQPQNFDLPFPAGQNAENSILKLTERRINGNIYIWYHFDQPTRKAYWFLHYEPREGTE